MNRRKLIQTLGLGALCSLTGLRTATLQAAVPTTVSLQKKTKPKNWVWVIAEKGKTTDYWKAKLEEAKRHGIDAILLEVYNGTHAFYDTDLFPVEENLLEQFIPICKSLGLELHAWLWTMTCNEESMLNKHPDWYAVNRLGESTAVNPPYVNYYKFLCPCHPEVQEFVSKKVVSLANVAEIDGIHLDYIQLPDVMLAEALQAKYNIVQDQEYPRYDYCYSDYCRKAFIKQTGSDPLTDLDNPASNKTWRQFRYDSITKIVNELLVPEVKKKSKVVTASVFPNWEQVRQEWFQWDLDGFHPLLYQNFYNKDSNWIGQQIQNELKLLTTDKPIYSGLFVPSFGSKELVEAYQTATKAGAAGVSLYNLNDMDAVKWRALKKIAKK